MSLVTNTLSLAKRGYTGEWLEFDQSWFPSKSKVHFDKENVGEKGGVYGGKLL